MRIDECTRQQGLFHLGEHAGRTGHMQLGGQCEQHPGSLRNDKLEMGSRGTCCASERQPRGARGR